MDYLGFVITSNFLKNPQPGNDMALHRIFSFYWNLYIHKHWEFHGFSSTLNLRGSENYGKSLCFLLLFPYYVNSLFPNFGIIWISALPKIFQKPITLKCLCFPIYFLYHGNSLFPYFGNCMDFCFPPNSWETHYFGMFGFFPILFPYYGNSLLPYSGNCMDFCFIRNI